MHWFCWELMGLETKFGSQHRHLVWVVVGGGGGWVAHCSPLTVQCPRLDIKILNQYPTFLAGQQEELLVQRRLLLHLPHVFQGQIFIRGGGVGALIQSCHYDGERVRPNTDVHPTRKRRLLHKKARRVWGGALMESLLISIVSRRRREIQSDATSTRFSASVLIGASLRVKSNNDRLFPAASRSKRTKPGARGYIIAGEA